MDTTQQAKEFFTGLQESIVERLENVDGKRFHRDKWERPEGGGGLSCVMEEGNVFERGGLTCAFNLGPEPLEWDGAGETLLPLLTEENLFVLNEALRPRRRVTRDGAMERVTKLRQISVERGATPHEDKALEDENSELVQVYNSEEEVRDLIDRARELEGLARNAKLFTILDKKHRIYAQRPTTRAGLPATMESGGMSERTT